MTIHSANNNVDLLRVTILSLEGIRIFSSLSASCCVGGGGGSGSDNDSDGVGGRSGNQNDHQKNSDSVNNIIGNNDLTAASISPSSQPQPYEQTTQIIISAHAGFRTTFPPESVSVSCPQYSTLFPLHEGNLLTVKSKEETVVVTMLDYGNDDDAGDNKNKSLVEIVLHWGADDEEKERENDADNSSNANSNDASSNKDETNKQQGSSMNIVPHLEIMLPSSSSSSSSSSTISHNVSTSSNDDEQCDDGAISEFPSSSPTPTIAALPDVIEFHVCVTITPATPDDRHAIVCVNGDHNCRLDENDIVDNDSFALDEGDTQQDHWLPPPSSSSSSTATIHHYGIAHLKLQPSELHHTNDDEFSTSSLSYGRPGGKVVVLPIRKKDEAFTFHRAAHYDDKESESKQQPQAQQQQQRSTDTVQFTSNAALFVRVERIRVPNIHHSKKMEQQCHYIESTWENGHGFAPASIIHHDDENDEGKDTKESVEKENKDRGTIWFTMKRSLFASTTSKESPTTRKDKDVILSEHSQMREEIAPTLYQAMAMTMEKREQYASHRINRINRRRSTGAASASAAAAAATDANRQTQSATSTNDERYSYPLRKSLSLQNIREKILCGASLPSMSETLKLVIEAGQHCDEDHGGLYVVNSNSFGGSTIGTAD
ncbi:hypothetical protein ACHAWU_008918 [Discostella pseudostelligera]|uniref:Uncharacterized protein n=1 Tax=Discostella pseudostelligera TaxID=259834 RepID=A0ABD3MB87_9STRA